MHLGKVTATPKAQVVDDPGVAMMALLDGKTIYLKQYGPLVSEVQRRMAEMRVTE